MNTYSMHVQLRILCSGSHSFLLSLALSLSLVFTSFAHNGLAFVSLLFYLYIYAFCSDDMNYKHFSIYMYTITAKVKNEYWECGI